MKWGEKSDFSRMNFVAVEDQARLVWNHHPTDANWNISANPMMPDWPQNLLTTVTFQQTGGTTNVRLEQVPVDASDAEITCFAEMMGNMDFGWGKGFDLIAKLLEEQT